MRAKKEGQDLLKCKVAPTNMSNVFPCLLCYFLRGGDYDTGVWYAWGFFFFALSLPLFLLFWGYQGSRRKGCPTMIGNSNLGQEMGKSLKKQAAVREGSGKPLPWPFGPHVAV